MYQIVSINGPSNDNIALLPKVVIYHIGMCSPQIESKYSKPVSFVNFILSYQCQTLKPSARRHLRWASIHFAQASSPCCTMHSSLSFLVSGQAQQIFFFGFVSGPVDVTPEPWFACEPCKAKEEEIFCMDTPLILTNPLEIKDTENRQTKEQKKNKC